jgi:tetratricopeptide (TPR) repeat protein
VKSSLVEWRDGRYGLHDLARVFAANRLDATERAGAEGRYAEHYVGVAATANNLYKKGGESLVLGLRLFDTEWGNIQAGQAWAAARVSEDDEAARLCSEYPYFGVYCLALRQHPREQIRWLECAAAAAQRMGDPGTEGAHLGNLGRAYADLGEVRRAIEFYEQALGIIRETGNRRQEGAVLGNLGVAYKNLGEPGRAIEFYKQQLQITRDIGDRRGEGNALNNLGVAYKHLGEPHRAVEFYEQRLRIAREIGDRRGESSALGNLGRAYADLGEVRRAMDFHEEQLRISREIGDRHREGTGLGNLGAAYADLGEPHRAIEFYKQRLQIAREIDDLAGEAKACWLLGLAYAQEGDFLRAVELMHKCVDYEHAIAHADAEKDAAILEAVRARLLASQEQAGESPERATKSDTGPVVALPPRPP